MWPQLLTHSERISQEPLRLHRCLLSKSQQRRMLRRHRWAAAIGREEHERDA